MIPSPGHIINKKSGDLQTSLLMPWNKSVYSCAPCHNIIRID